MSVWLGGAAFAATLTASVASSPAAASSTDPSPAPTSAEPADAESRIEVAGSLQLGYHERRPLPLAPGIIARPNATPAAALGLMIGGTLKRRPTLQAYGALGYRTGLGMRASFSDPAGTPRQPRVRSQDFNLDLGLRKSMTPTPGQLRLGLAVGYVLRPFHPELKIGLPGFALHGPVVKPTLDAVVANEVVRLSLQPHVGAAFATRSKEAAAATALGPVFGGAVSLGFRIVRRLHFTLQYREQHALLVSGGVRQHDIARWATAGITFIHLSPKEQTR